VITLPAVAMVLWGVGALLLLVRAASGVIRARGVVRRSQAAPSWSRAHQAAMRVTSVHASIRQTTELLAPAVFGFLRPVVLVPAASSDWTHERQYGALLHELAHVRSHDCTWKLVAQFATALHFWNPFVWLLSRRLRQECELAADDAVVAAGARASTYAKDLVCIARAQLPQSPLAALGMADQSDLALRVLRIVGTEHARAPVSATRMRLLVAGSFMLALGASCATPSINEQAHGPESAKSTQTPETTAKKSLGGATKDDASSVSSIDTRLQAVADDEVARAVAEWHAKSGVVLVLDPSTGQVVANAGLESGAKTDIGVTRAFVTGSTLKMVTLAAALEAGVLTPTEHIDCENGKYTYDGHVMDDAAPYGMLTVAEVLAVSSNVAFTKIFDRLGGARLEQTLTAFHLGTRPDVDGATAGTMPRGVRDHSFGGAVLAVGESLTASPLQLASAFGAVANGGEYVPPTMKKRSAAPSRERILKPETARMVTDLLESAVYSEHATGKRAQIKGVRVAGKTGTAGYARPDGSEGRYASFVGFAPSSAPRYVVIVGLDEPGDGNGGSAAAPVFARVMSRALAN
jgi:beta-lactamase regulating signal transducer with metallopeptidase domain